MNSFFVSILDYLNYEDRKSIALGVFVKPEGGWPAKGGRKLEI